MGNSTPKIEVDDPAEKVRKDDEGNIYELRCGKCGEWMLVAHRAFEAICAHAKFGRCAELRRRAGERYAREMREAELRARGVVPFRRGA